MDIKIVSDKIKEVADNSTILLNEPMNIHTTFRTGGAADIFVIPDSINSISNVIKVCIENNVDYYIIGKGSNLLVKDEGYRGVIICVYDTLDDVSFEEDGDFCYVMAGAGIMLIKLAMLIAGKELEGFEYASGIPGTLGGAVTMNAGAYGGEIKDNIISAKVMDQKGDVYVLSKDELALGYRNSIIQKERYIVLEATFRLKKGNAQEIKAKMDDFNGRRRDKQPLEYPSAGSTFKRPEGYFAGKLIQDAGLSGYRVGGACVSSKHCGFVINDKNATSTDILQLMKDVDEKVYSAFGVHLEPEVRIL